MITALPQNYENQALLLSSIPLNKHNIGGLKNFSISTHVYCNPWLGYKRQASEGLNLVGIPGHD